MPKQETGASFIVATAPDRRVRSTETQIDALEKIIAEAQRQIHALQNPYQEYPKWVKGLTVQNAEQEKAVLDGSAEIEEIQAASGVQRTVK